MLEIIIDNIYSRTADKFDKLYGLAELVKTREDKFEPKIYAGGGQYLPIDWDHFAGVGYFRLNGDVSISKSSFETRNCTQYYDVVYPIKLIGCIKKSILGKDDSFSGEVVCMTLFRDIAQSNGDLCAVTKSVFSDIEITGYSTDVNKILGDEFQGLARKSIVPLDYCLVSLDIRVSVTINQDCIQFYCSSYCDYSRWTSSGTICLPQNFRPAPITIAGVFGVADYADTRLKGKRIENVFINNTRLLTSQYSFDSTTGTLTYIDANIQLQNGDEIYLTFY